MSRTRVHEVLSGLRVDLELAQSLLGFEPPESFVPGRIGVTACCEQRDGDERDCRVGAHHGVPAAPIAEPLSDRRLRGDLQRLIGQVAVEIVSQIGRGLVPLCRLRLETRADNRLQSRGNVPAERAKCGYARLSFVDQFRDFLEDGPTRCPERVASGQQFEQNDPQRVNIAAGIGLRQPTADFFEVLRRHVRHGSRYDGTGQPRP